ncbi:glycosyltransferase family 4 protein [Massilia sp. S19_KUP03_FR1]|uniref:glycosyltransferase family 4 protein n=1 Tax=Massilia sp. S19_KUP03_FR1 TaxID=3025503 RepID=UPI002FCD7737
MKILLFINNLAGGGAERVVTTLANFWIHQGREVTVVTLGSENDDFYPLDRRVSRVSLNLAGQSRGVWDAFRQNVQRILALRRLLRQIEPTVAIAAMSTPSVLLALASCGLANMCTIGSERCYPPHAPLGRIWGYLRSKMYGQLSAVIALTRESAEWITAHSSARRVAVIPNAALWPLPDNPPAILPQACVSFGRRLLLAVGRLEVVKNADELIRAFAQLAKKHPDWDLAILGEGPERASLEAIIKDQALTTRVFMPGIVGNVGAWYAHADLYAMTSRSEGFPNALVEAMSHGLAAVSVDCDTGPRDIIRDGIDGVLVPPNNSAALVNALDRVMGDATFRGQLADRAREARERFSIEKIAGMWDALFHELSPADTVLNIKNKSSALNRYGS